MSSGGSFIEKIPGATGASFNNGWKGLAGIKGDGHFGLSGGGLIPDSAFDQGGGTPQQVAAGAMPSMGSPLQRAGIGQQQPQFQQLQQSPVFRALAQRNLMR